jgi:hypothetical protein
MPSAAQLPSLYQPWIEELLGGPIPAEEAATCDDCAMVNPEGPEAPSSVAAASVFFDPRVKCCTYIPELPNFLVGRILLDTSPEAAAGRESLLGRLAVVQDATPLGLAQPPAFAVVYGAGGATTFGRGLQLRCPHFLPDTGGCGIWRHRQSVCATWFCKFNRGLVGGAFWEALLRLLQCAERALAVHCVRALHPGPLAAQHAVQSRAPRPKELQAADVGASVDRAARQRLWGSYDRREVAFYEGCARLVASMTWEDVRRAGGVDLEIAADVLRDAYRALLATDVPKRLRVGTIAVTHRDGLAECTSYSGYDPLTVPRALLEVLHVFDGRPTARAMAAARAAGVELTRGVVRRLVDHGVLEDADSPSRDSLGSRG